MTEDASSDGQTKFYVLILYVTLCHTQNINRLPDISILRHKVLNFLSCRTKSIDIVSTLWLGNIRSIRVFDFFVCVCVCVFLCVVCVCVCLCVCVCVCMCVCGCMDS